MTRILGKWTNKTRTLIIGSRGLDYRSRHFMSDLRTIMPHAKADTKLDKKNDRVSNVLSCFSHTYQSSDPKASNPSPFVVIVV